MEVAELPVEVASVQEAVLRVVPSVEVASVQEEVVSLGQTAVFVQQQGEIQVQELAAALL